MATRGKHVKAPKHAAKRGKHAAAEVRVARDARVTVVTMLLVVAVIAVPFSFNRFLVAAEAAPVHEMLINTQMDAAEAPYSLSAQSVAPVQESETSNTAVTPQAFADAPEQEDATQSSKPVDAATPASELPKVEYDQRVDAQLQEPVMSGGCEIVSLGIVLDSMQLESDIHEVVDEHLTIDGHFATGYAGNPYYAGGGYPEGIVQAANSYLAKQECQVEAHDITGAEFEDLLAYVQKGYPVMVWMTMRYEDPLFETLFDGEKAWYNNEHCVVLYGEKDDKVLVSDPLEGLIEQDMQRFAELFKACGSMAAVLY